MIKPINSVPYRCKNLPKGLIYNMPNTRSYNLIKTENGEKIGKMYAFVQDDHHYFYEKFPYLSVLYIENLFVEESERGKGWGKYLMDFVKKLSFAKNCEGRTTLVAFDPDRSPHLFYRKQGFETLYDDFNEEMDEYIKNNKEFEVCIDAIPMYLPVKNIKK